MKKTATADKLNNLGNTANGIPLLEAIEYDMILNAESPSNLKDIDNSTGLTGYSTGLTMAEYAERLDAIQTKTLDDFLADSYAWSEVDVPEEATKREVHNLQMKCIAEDAEMENFVFVYDEPSGSIVYRF